MLIRFLDNYKGKNIFIGVVISTIRLLYALSCLFFVIASLFLPKDLSSSQILGLTIAWGISLICVIDSCVDDYLKQSDNVRRFISLIASIGTVGLLLFYLQCYFDIFSLKTTIFIYVAIDLIAVLISLPIFLIKDKRQIKVETLVLSYLFTAIVYLFFVSIFYDEVVLLYPLGALAVLGYLYSYISFFMNCHQFNTKSWKARLIMTMVDLLIATAIVVYILWYIPEAISEIITPIFASILGGLLTFGGVLLTLNYNNYQKKEEEINKAKPYLRKGSLNGNQTNGHQMQSENFEGLNVYDSKLSNEEYKSVKDKNLIVILNFAIQQSSDNICIITGIKINDVIYKLKSKQVLTKNESLFFVLGKTIEVAEFNSLQIIASDIYDNYYAYELEFEENGQERFLKDNNQKGNYITLDSAYFPDDFSYKKYSITDIGMPQKIDYRKEEENHGQDGKKI